MKSNRDYQAAFKAKMEAQGFKQTVVWAHPDDQEKIRKLAKKLIDARR